ncbi:hypothetical protein M9H77_17038 [Catharanthus roseus]|uniref:Uncharacterized protein n=1 Tax=Catharanthus roseus TaxID=4058 RepID=A0ACC0B3G6_CATRO|nr:hypothetical protein M9H77_17038 [Catharanthus roseus]
MQLFVIERSYGVWLISSERSGTQQATETRTVCKVSFYVVVYVVEILCSERTVPRGTQMPYSAAVDLVEGLGTSQVVLEPLGWILGPEMASVAPGIGLGISIKEDPSEPTSDSEMTPEPERLEPAFTGDMGTFVANSLPVAASPTSIPPVESVFSFPALPSLLRGGVREHEICGYCLWREQRVKATGQQIMELINEGDWLRQFIAQFLGTTRDLVDRPRDELESR